jgi:hypothetical protein
LQPCLPYALGCCCACPLPIELESRVKIKNQDDDRGSHLQGFFVIS